MSKDFRDSTAHLLSLSSSFSPVPFPTSNNNQMELKPRATATVTRRTVVYVLSLGFGLIGVYRDEIVVNPSLVNMKLGEWPFL